MKLTKQQRHMAYMIMLAEAEEVLDKVSNGIRIRHFAGGEAAGLCDMIENILEIDLHGKNPMEYLGITELIKKEPPVPFFDYWFPHDRYGWQTRISLLKQCIEETADAWPK